MIDVKHFQETLEDLIFNNADYKNLQAYLGDFNIFDAVGMSSQEIKHSAFLAYLFNPTTPHYLGDTFLKEFLIRTVKQVEIDLSTIEIDTSDYSNSSVRTEESTDKGQHIDIFIHNEAHKLIVVIENKIYSSETGNQLSDYKTFVESQYIDYRHLFVYLTPDERTPEDDDMATAYANVTYSDIAEIIECTIANTKNRGNQEQITLMRHYVEMLKRQGIIDDPIVNTYQKLWNKQYAPALNILKEIYETKETHNYPRDILQIAKHLHQSHHHASMEYLYTLKPNLRTQIKNLVKSFIEVDNNFIILEEKRYVLNLSLREWDLFNNTEFVDTQHLNHEHRLITLHLGNYSNVLFFSADICIREKPLRSLLARRIFENRDKEGYKGAFNRIKRRRNSIHIFVAVILTESDLTSTPVLTSDLKEKIKGKWDQVIRNHLKPLQTLVARIRAEDTEWKRLESEWYDAHTNEGNV